MDADIKKLKKLVKFMQKEGVLNLKIPEIELQLAASAIQHPDTDVPDTATTEQPIQDQYDPEEVLFWSAPGISPNTDEVN